MSWARLDDSFWRHPKVSALLESATQTEADDREVLEALAAVGLWALGLAYTNQKGTPDFSGREAMMVTGIDSRHRGILDSLRARLRGAGLFDRRFEAPREANREAGAKHAVGDTAKGRDVAGGFSESGSRSRIEAGFSPASKQGERSASEADVYHDWSTYRSKDEAKARAGAQGGKKSGESRRAKSKQNPSKDEADPQAESKPRSPIPVPQVCRDQEAVTLEEFTTAVANAGIAIQTGRSEREWFSKLHPVDRSELEHALDCAARAKSKPRRGAYVLEVIESERRKAEDIAKQPKPPPRRQRQEDDSCDFVPPYLRPENNWSLQERLERERQQAAEAAAEVEP